MSPNGVICFTGILGNPENVDSLSEGVCVCVVFPRQLIVHLKVFSKFTNPRALYLEPQLSELYTKVPHTHHFLFAHTSLPVTYHITHYQLLSYDCGMQRDLPNLRISFGLLSPPTTFFYCYPCLSLSIPLSFPLSFFSSLHSCCAIRIRTSRKWPWSVCSPIRTLPSCHTSQYTHTHTLLAYVLVV